jgi:hypothetical protein
MLVTKRLYVFADLRFLRQLVFDRAVWEGASERKSENHVRKYIRCLLLRLP